ncbi:hypothetical protein C8Q79DRAFT_343079 [Trametes meyenii]|nr:hypothetical protein C8Q79DRAFT_343079 [Trametes meyenii]
MKPLTREEVLNILASMGIELPKGTKLLDTILDKRLHSALDAAQEKERCAEILNRTGLPHWPLVKADELDSRARPVLDAVKRGNWNEARNNSLSNLLGGPSTQPDLFTDPFMDLRQTVMSLANVLDQGMLWCTIQDPEREQHAINIRILDVYELDERTPAMVILYSHFSRENALEGARWVQDQVQKNPKNIGGIGMDIKATLLEQKLLLKLLSINTKLLPHGYTPKRGRYEEKYRATVVLPLGPLGPEAIGKLNNNTGCDVCGKHSGLRCGQCQSASYCGPTCQKADWPSHKQACRSLKGGRWVKIPFRAAVPGTESMQQAVINRYTTMTRAEDIPANSLSSGDSSSLVPPPNTQGNKPFLMKIQVGLYGPGRDTMMLYDRQRSFGQVWAVRMDGAATFADLVAEMAGPRGGYGGVKMYRWAKRTGDWEFTICVDRQPEIDIKW